VSKQTFEALTGNVGLEIRGNASVPGAGIQPYAEALLEKDLKGDSRTVFYAQTDAPGIVNSFDYPDRSQHLYGRLAGGASATILGGVGVEAAVSTTVGKRQGNEVSAHLGLRVGF